MSQTAADLIGTDDLDAPVAEPPKVLKADTIAGLKITGPASEGYINMLIYGESGTTKTRTAGSACVVPTMGPVLLIDFEGGTLSLGRDYKDVQVVRCKSWDDCIRLYNALYDNNPFNTIILDSLTELQKFIMRMVMKEVVQKNSDRDEDIASLREWGKQGEMLRRLIRGLRDLPCNTIFTALHHEQTNDDGKVIRIRPGLPGQLKGEVAGYMDIVLYAYKKEVVQGPERYNEILMLSEGTEVVLAKDRSGMLPQILQQPSMLDIYNHINGQEKEEKEQ
jgi:hypothetical protein